MVLLLWRPWYACPLPRLAPLPSCAAAAAPVDLSLQPPQPPPRQSPSAAPAPSHPRTLAPTPPPARPPPSMPPVAPRLTPLYPPRPFVAGSPLPAAAQHPLCLDHMACGIAWLHKSNHRLKLICFESYVYLNKCHFESVALPTRALKPQLLPAALCEKSHTTPLSPTTRLPSGEPPLFSNTL